MCVNNRRSLHRVCEADGCQVGEALTTLVKGPSATPFQEAVRSDNVSGIPEARMEATGIDLRSEWIHRGIHLGVRGEKSHYSQDTVVPLPVRERHLSVTGGR